MARATLPRRTVLRVYCPRAHHCTTTVQFSCYSNFAERISEFHCKSAFVICTFYLLKQILPIHQMDDSHMDVREFA